MDAETKRKIEARIQGGDTAEFDRWMGKAEIKMLISLLPPSANESQRDCLKTVLRAAYESGFHSGVSAMIMSMFEGMPRPPWER